MRGKLTVGDMQRRRYVAAIAGADDVELLVVDVVDAVLTWVRRRWAGHGHGAAAAVAVGADLQTTVGALVMVMVVVVVQMRRRVVVVPLRGQHRLSTSRRQENN